MTLTPILIVGVGGHATSCIDVIEQSELFEVAGLVGSADEIGKELFGYPVLGTDQNLPELVVRYRHGLVAVGHIRTPQPRIRLFEQLRQLGCEMPSIVSRHAYVSRHAVLGAGTIVMHGAVVNANAIVGNNCIVNSQSLLEHDVVIADHCHISTAATLNGGVRVGRGTFIGSGSKVRERIVIGENCLIGMGQEVMVDCDVGTRVPSKRSP